MPSPTEIARTDLEHLPPQVLLKMGQIARFGIFADFRPFLASKLRPMTSSCAVVQGVLQKRSRPFIFHYAALHNCTTRHKDDKFGSQAPADESPSTTCLRWTGGQIECIQTTNGATQRQLAHVADPVPVTQAQLQVSLRLDEQKPYAPQEGLSRHG